MNLFLLNEYNNFLPIWYKLLDIKMKYLVVQMWHRTLKNINKSMVVNSWFLVFNVLDLQLTFTTEQFNVYIFFVVFITIKPKR
jgi:hypothetical protein